MKLGQAIKYEQNKEQRGRRAPKSHCYSPMNQSTQNQPQFDLERSCGGNTGKTESGGSVPRSNILDDMEDDEFKMEVKHKINDELTADLAGAKQQKMGYRERLYSSSGVIIEGFNKDQIQARKKPAE